jgi:ketosteroid isomerase-like protein
MVSVTNYSIKYMNRSIHAVLGVLLCTAVVFSAGCVQNSPKTDLDLMGQTVLDLEYEMNLDVDRNDCAAGLIHLGDREPVFVMQSQVTRNSVDLRQNCSRRERVFESAQFDISQRKVNVLSPTVAYVVREGDYTMNYVDGRTITRFGVMTTIWNQVDGTWKMVHLHESWEDSWPAPEPPSN